MINAFFSLINRFISAENCSASPLFNFLGATGEAISSSDYDISVWETIRDKVVGFVMHLIYLVCKWALNIVDFMELIIKKLAGITTSAYDTNTVSLDNPILQFILSDTILTIFMSLLGLSVVLLILFTIVAIVKAEYSEDVQQTEKVKKRVYKNAIRSVFLILMVPIIAIGSIIFSDTVLNSFYHALTGNDYAATSLGGQIFIASSYEANKFRNYADNGQRVPILLNFEDPSLYGSIDSYSAEELVSVYDSWTNGKDIYKMFTKGTFSKFEDTTTTINGQVYNKNSYSHEYESFVCTKEQYYVMADFVDFAVKGNIHFYYKCASDADIKWTGVTGYTKTTNCLIVNYVTSAGDVTTVSYNLGANNSTTPMEDALTAIYQILAIGDYSDSLFRYLSKGTTSSNLVDWTCEQCVVVINGVINYFPVYVMTPHVFNETYNGYVDSSETIMGTVLDNGKIFVKIQDEPTVSIDADGNVSEGEDYYSLKSVGAGEVATVATDSNNNIDYNTSGLISYMLTTEDDGSGKSSYYLAEKLYKKTSFPEKLIRDLEAIYGDINIDNFINTDSWADALGEYVKVTGSTSLSSAFNTSQIHPLGLIMAEIFLGTVADSAEGTSFSALKFDSLFSDSATSSLIKTIAGEENYENVKMQLQFYCEFFNAMMAPVLDELAYYEGFSVKDLNSENVDLYTLKAYLATLLFSGNICGYFVDSVNEIILIEDMINDLSTNPSNAGEFYNFSGLNTELKNNLYVEFNSNDAEQNKKSIFWNLIYSYYEKKGKKDEEINAIFTETNGKVNANLGLPDYIESFARYVGAYEYLGTESTNYWKNEYNCYYENTGAGILKEDIISISDANKIRNNLSKIKQEIQNFYNTNVVYQNTTTINTNRIKANASAESIGYSDLMNIIFNYINKSDENYEEEYQGMLTWLKGNKHSDEYDVIVHFVENCKKYNRLEKYNLIYSLQVAQSEILNGTYSITINNKKFYTQINMTTQKFKEIVYGNQSYASSLLPKLNSNVKIAYENLSDTEKAKLDAAVAIGSDDNDFKERYNYYRIMNNINEIGESLLSKVTALPYSSLNDGEKTLLGLIFGTNYESEYNDYVNGTDNTLDGMANIYLISQVNLLEGLYNLVDISYLNEDEFWDTLYDLVSERYTSEKLYFVSENYEGLLVTSSNGDASAFALLREFVNDFGSICFELNNKTSFAKLMENYDDVVGTETYKSAINKYVSSRIKVYKNDKENLNKIANVKSFCEFLGIEYEDKENEIEAPTSLKELRLRAIEVLGSYEARAQDNEVTNRIRYLELFYLTCSDYDSSNNIVVNNSSKKAIMQLAGVQDRPDSELVGLEYTVNFESDRKDEANGDVFILCTYDKVTEMYLPVTVGSKIAGETGAKFKFESQYQKTGEVVVAKGVFDNDNLPTAIREVNGNIEFYRQTPCVVDAVSMGIGTYYQSVNDVVIFQSPLTMMANQVTKWFTGETLTEKLLNAVPRVWVDADLYLPYGVKETCVYHLDNGSVVMNYGFNEANGIAIECLYSTCDLNVIILVFGSIFLFSMIGKAVWGIIKRIYDIVLLFLINPLVISAIPLTEMDEKQQKDNPSPYSQWRGMFVERVMNIFGLVLGLTIFFMLADMIENMTFVTETSKLAQDLSDFWIFKGKNIVFVNHIFRLVFLFGAILTIASAPKLFGKIMGFGNIFDEGSAVRGHINNIESNVSDVVTGQAALDKIERHKRNINSIPLVEKIKSNKAKKEEKKYNGEVDSAKQEAIKKGVSSNDAEVAAQMLKDNYTAMKLESGAMDTSEGESLKQRENYGKLVRGDIDQSTYDKTEKKRAKKIKDKVKKWSKKNEKFLEKENKFD